MWQQWLTQIQRGDVKALARSISAVENEVAGYQQLLTALQPNKESQIIGITGPPGAGKSTLVDALIQELVQQGNRVAVLCVDPSSPFNLGALLGDRIRMSQWYNNENVFIRSLATRGSMGGLHPKIIEISELVKEAGYNYVIIETVGVGQSEIEIAGLADTTIVVLVPEGGDEIQTMKAGLMEIADLFVVNKSDRPGADTFVANLRLMLAPSFQNSLIEIPIIKTVATTHIGIADLYKTLKLLQKKPGANERKYWLLAERAYWLLSRKKMQGIEKLRLERAIKAKMEAGNFNLYAFVEAMATD